MKKMNIWANRMGVFFLIATILLVVGSASESQALGIEDIKSDIINYAKAGNIDAIADLASQNPALAAVIAKIAAKANPTLAIDIAAAVATVVPNMAAEIAAAVATVVPNMAAEIAAAVATVVPVKAAEIAAAVATVVPNMAAKIAAMVIAVAPQYKDSIKQSIADAITLLEGSEDEGAPPTEQGDPEPYGQ